MRSLQRLLVSAGMALLAQAHAETAGPLPALNVDIRDTSVSGLSSGAFMAVQFMVAHSSIVRGAGVVAGGPYYCAQGNAITATTRCSCTLDAAHQVCDVSADSTDIKSLETATRGFAARKLIDDPQHLSAQRALLIAGGKDRTVPKSVVIQLHDYLRDMGVSRSNLTLVELADAGHGMPTPGYGAACNATGAPYINDCDFDAAGRILAWIYGPLQPARSGARLGRFLRFDQRPFQPGGFGKWTSGLDTTGWLYLPDDCSKGEKCRLHIALHGCRQGQSYAPLAGLGGTHVGTTFVENAGYDAWADTNRIVVLFPQAVSVMGRNPNGCWDWWGYTDSHYADQRGVQIGAIRAMADRLAGGAGGR